MYWAYFTTLDLDCSRGLGLELDKRFSIKKKLDDPHYRNLHFYDENTHDIDLGSIVLIDNTLGLVARTNVGEPLTMGAVEACLENLYRVCDRHYISSVVLEDPSWYNPEITSEMVNKYILKSIGLQRKLNISIRGVDADEFNNGYSVFNIGYSRY